MFICWMKRESSGHQPLAKARRKNCSQFCVISGTCRPTCQSLQVRRNEEMILMEEQIRQTLTKAVAEFLDQPEETIDCSAELADVGVDSLQAVQLLVLLERTYHIEISEEELKHFTSIDSIVARISKHPKMAIGA